MSVSRKQTKKGKFSIDRKYEAFYTGGRVQFSKDGQFMLCSCGGQVKIISVENGKIQYSIPEKESADELSSFLLADDDHTLIIATQSGVLRQWNLKYKTVTRTWKSIHIGHVSCMAFDKTITLLATGGSDSTIKVWDTEQKFCTHNLKGAQGVFSIVCFQFVDSKLHIFGAADDYKICVWDLKSSSRILALEGHYSTITSISFIEQQNKMISCSRDKVVLIWDLATYSLLKTIPVYETIEALILLPENTVLPKLQINNEDDAYFITAGDRGILRVWQASSGKCLYVQENSLVSPPIDSEYEGQIITQAAYIPALQAISVVTYEHNILLYNLQDFALLKQFVGYNDDVLDIKLMGEDDSFLAVATNSPHIKLFKLDTFSCQLLKGHLDIVVALDVFPQNQNMLISGSKDNSVRVWKMHEWGTINCIYMGYGHTHSVYAVACCRSKPNFFLSGSQDTTLKLWDIPTKKPVIALKLNLSARCTAKAHDKNINSIAVSSNDKYIATGSQDHTAKIWNATDLTHIGTMRGHKKGVWCVVFSPVDLVLATSSGDREIKIWSLSDFTMLKTFEGHESSVLKVVFLSRGTQLMSSASNGLLKLWDIKTNDCIKTFEGHEDKVWALAASSNEDFLFTGGADSNIIVWKDVTEEEKEQSLAKQEELILQEQNLKNLIHYKKWLKALGLAITLEQPFRAITIIDEILLETNGEETLTDTIKKLREDQLVVIAQFAVEWNKTLRNCIPANLIIKAMFEKYGTDVLMKLPNRLSIAEQLRSYTERHCERLDALMVDLEILEFMDRCIKIPTQDDEGEPMSD